MEGAAARGAWARPRPVSPVELRKILRPFVEPAATLSVVDETPPLISATLVRPNVALQRYRPRSRTTRALGVAHAESVVTVVPVMVDLEIVPDRTGVYETTIEN